MYSAPEWSHIRTDRFPRKSRYSLDGLELDAAHEANKEANGNETHQYPTSRGL